MNSDTPEARKEWLVSMTVVLTLDAMRTILAPHVGHTVTINGHERTVTAESLVGDAVGWDYGGFAVACVPCGISLSDQWN